MPPRPPPTLLAALLLYGLLAAFTVRDVGVVGEVAAAFTAGDPPRVAAAIDAQGPTWSGPPAQTHAGSSWGPLRASQTRPLERLQLGGVSLPLAVNSYTGGLADWPARLLNGLGVGFAGLVALHVLLGALLLWAVHGIASRQAGPLAASATAVLLACDWSFLFYRKVLGGTEILLQAAGLLLLWALWQRRWSGARWTGWGLALALGLGLLAKVTFVATVAALLAAAWLSCRDCPANKSPRPPLRPLRGLLILAALCAPLWISFLHHLALPAEPSVVSHDTLTLQLARLQHGLSGLFSGGSAPDREMAASALYFLFAPLRWFEGALGASAPPLPSAALRALSWVLVLAGAGLAWRDRLRGKPQLAADALLRLLSLAVPLQLLALWLLNRDLHHLAQTAPMVALLCGLSLARLVRSASKRRAALLALLCLPAALAGAWDLRATDGLLASLRTPAFTERGQVQLEELLQRQGVQQLWTSDYDLYGVFELRAPQLQVAHAWGAASCSRDRDALLGNLLRAVQGGHYLVVRPSAPMIYNLTPSDKGLRLAAAGVGLSVDLQGQLQDGEGTWARLYRVR